MSGLINCGERKVQAVGRVALTDIFDRYGIKQGDTVEIYIRKTNTHP